MRESGNSDEPGSVLEVVQDSPRRRDFTMLVERRGDLGHRRRL